MLLKQKIHNFLDVSESFPARTFRIILIILIISSSLLAILQLLGISFLDSYEQSINLFERTVLGIFTIELLLRVFITDSFKKYLSRSINWIDIVSVVPFYLWLPNTTMLRLFRVLRIMKFKRWNLADFFDKPETKLWIFVRFLIIFLILVSSWLALIQLFFSEILSWYEVRIELFEKIVLAIFSVEFFTRFFASRSLRGFFSKPSNWIDFLAIAPFYFGINDAAILRIFRALRLLKIFNSINILKWSRVFDFKHSILRIVSPIIAIFSCIKVFVWILESRDLWIPESDLKTLFTIIGFSLGVILSQKIGKSYGKYIQIQDLFYKLHGKLSSLQLNLNVMKSGSWDTLIHNWLKSYMNIYHANSDSGALKDVRKINEEIYLKAADIWNTEHIPFHRLAAMLWWMFEIAITIQSKRINRTPLTYNLLLQQVILVYLLGLAVFIPWYVGLISVIFGGYLLYGMFQLTNDFDDVRAPSHDKQQDIEDGYLITLDAQRIENYLQELEEKNKEL